MQKLIDLGELHIYLNGKEVKLFFKDEPVELIGIQYLYIPEPENEKIIPNDYSYRVIFDGDRLLGESYYLEKALRNTVSYIVKLDRHLARFNKKNPKEDNPKNWTCTEFLIPYNEKNFYKLEEFKRPKYKIYLEKDKQIIEFDTPKKISIFETKKGLRVFYQKDYIYALSTGLWDDPFQSDILKAIPSFLITQPNYPIKTFKFYARETITPTHILNYAIKIDGKIHKFTIPGTIKDGEFKSLDNAITFKMVTIKNYKDFGYLSINKSQPNKFKTTEKFIQILEKTNPNNSDLTNIEFSCLVHPLNNAIVKSIVVEKSSKQTNSELDFQDLFFFERDLVLFFSY